MCCSPKFHIGKKFYIVEEICGKREVVEGTVTGIYGTPGIYYYEIEKMLRPSEPYMGAIKIYEPDLEQELNFRKWKFFNNRYEAESYIKNTMTEYEKKLKEEKLFEDTISLFKDKITELSKDVSLEFINPRIFRNINQTIEEIKKEYAQYVQE